MTSPSPNPITVKGTSGCESALAGAASALQLEAAMQELGDSLTMAFSPEMEVLYNPLNLNSKSKTRVIPQNELKVNTMITEYDFPSSVNGMDANN